MTFIQSPFVLSGSVPSLSYWLSMSAMSSSTGSMTANIVLKLPQDSLSLCFTLKSGHIARELLYVLPPLWVQVKGQREGIPSLMLLICFHFIPLRPTMEVSLFLWVLAIFNDLTNIDLFACVPFVLNVKYHRTIHSSKRFFSYGICQQICFVTHEVHKFRVWTLRIIIIENYVRRNFILSQEGSV